MSKETYLSWLYSESASTLCEQEEEKTNMEWKTSTLGVLVRLFFFTTLCIHVLQFPVLK